MTLVIVDRDAVRKKRTMTPKLHAQVRAMTASREARIKSGELKRPVRRPTLAQLQRMADEQAREKFLLFASANVLPVGDALIEKAKSGDVTAIKEFFDRIWGKAPQSVKHEIKFSLTDLHNSRAALGSAVPLDAVDGNPGMRIIESTIQSEDDDEM